MQDLKEATQDLEHIRQLMPKPSAGPPPSAALTPSADALGIWWIKLIRERVRQQNGPSARIRERSKEKEKQNEGRS